MRLAHVKRWALFWGSSERCIHSPALQKLQNRTHKSHRRECRDPHQGMCTVLVRVIAEASGRGQSGFRAISEEIQKLGGVGEDANIGYSPRV